jgi:1-acyl-sn-glycerol-3-phosphate acyltransferase
MLRTAFALAVTAALTILLGTPAVLAGLLVRGSDATMRLGRIWSRGILRAAGVRPRYEGLENVAASEPCVFLANHQSLLDIFVLVPVLPPATRFVAKRSLFFIPFFGWSLKVSGFIPIERRSYRRAYESLERAADAIRAGRSVVLFPEGTRSRSGKLQPFKRGAFHLAVRARVPVVPVAISGTGRALPPGRWKVRPGSVRVSFAPPIAPLKDEAAGVGALMAAVRERIAERLDPEERGEAEERLPARGNP